MKRRFTELQFAVVNTRNATALCLLLLDTVDIPSDQNMTMTKPHVYNAAPRYVMLNSSSYLTGTFHTSSFVSDKFFFFWH
jgi:hypothetical protein